MKKIIPLLLIICAFAYADPSMQSDGYGKYLQLKQSAIEEQNAVLNDPSQEGTRFYAGVKLGMLDPSNAENAQDYAYNLEALSLFQFQDLADIVSTNYPEEYRQKAYSELQALSKDSLYRQAIADYENCKIPASNLHAIIPEPTKCIQ